jgi:hypothetical protein
MSSFLTNLLLLALAALPIGLILRGIFLIWEHKSTPRMQKYSQPLKPGWVYTEAEIIDKGEVADGSNPPYYVTFRYTDSSGQVYTKIQSISAEQYSALLKGSITEVTYPKAHPHDARLLMPQRTYAHDSDSLGPTYESVINGILLPFVFVINLLQLGSLLQGAVPIRWAKTPMETDTGIERGWTYIVGGLTIIALFACILLFTATLPGQMPSTR